MKRILKITKLFIFKEKQIRTAHTHMLSWNSGRDAVMFPVIVGIETIIIPCYSIMWKRKQSGGQTNEKREMERIWKADRTML